MLVQLLRDDGGAQYPLAEQPCVSGDRDLIGDDAADDFSFLILFEFARLIVLRQNEPPSGPLPVLLQLGAEFDGLASSRR